MKTRRNSELTFLITAVISGSALLGGGSIDAAELWEMADVPRGKVEHVVYASASTGAQHEYYVYAPPGYDASGDTEYPVLYLIHGLGGGASSWMERGSANVILDNLIAAGRAKPMILVMPLAYGVVNYPDKIGGDAPPNLSLTNRERFQSALYNEIIPQVEVAYRTRSDWQSRAIAGFSMGGAMSLEFGISSPEKFAWIGGFSAAIRTTDFEVTFPGASSGVAEGRSLIWMGCGTEDRLMTNDALLRGYLRENSLEVTWEERPGGHVWPVPRAFLTQFAPLLF